MREIKFRAWDKDLNKMDYKIEICIAGKAYLNSYLNSIDNLMQYTGLKDKNGKEIYEGDIVEGKPPEFVNYVKGEVKYGGLAFSFVGENLFYTVTNQSVKQLNEIEIIGNIYQNPELLY